MDKVFEITFIIPVYQDGSIVTWDQHLTKVVAPDKRLAIADFWAIWCDCNSLKTFQDTRIIETRLVG